MTNGAHDDASAPREGDVVASRYRLGRLIGRGGVGAVFEAERLADGARVALKRIELRGARDEVVAGRFAREVRAASTVQSPHIVGVLDVGTDRGSPFLVMDLLEGEDLGERLRRDRRLDARDAVEVARQVLVGLEDAHAAGVIHRDLKPDNLFLVSTPGVEAWVKVLDFGISKIQQLGGTVPLALTLGGVAIGTPLYMSPEQALARGDLDARSDLYSLGAILFECLTARPPHVGESSDAILEAIRTTEAPALRPLAPEVPARLAAVIDRALAYDRGDRYASAREFRQALEGALGAARPRAGARRQWIAGGLALVAGAASAVALAWALRG